MLRLVLVCVTQADEARDPRRGLSNGEGPKAQHGLCCRRIPNPDIDIDVLLQLKFSVTITYRHSDHSGALQVDLSHVIANVFNV
jgi:hypothetical protein